MISNIVVINRDRFNALIKTFVYHFDVVIIKEDDKFYTLRKNIYGPHRPTEMTEEELKAIAKEEGWK